MAADYTFTATDYSELDEQVVQVVSYYANYGSNAHVELEGGSGSGGGGGGSVRPSSGFLYPRGDN